ncbi:GntR family transcriptional regulator [Streptosporangium sp. NPDC050855]|uniref:GntR family transcriptional regulator n=1 Tax=Streptosporangium sp. NPDC050855 TaxID=3366194 RepID=UPI0037A33C69
MKIDLGSFEPRHRQLARMLRAQIEGGEYRAGQRLPSEERLQQMSGLGRTTVRRALGVLRSEGLVRTVTGSGTYVRGNQEVTMLEVGHGTVISTRVPTEEERRTLGLDEGVPVFVIQRPGEGPELLRGDTNRLVVG